MPAGVSWGVYLRYTAAALLSMLAGAQTVHIYYNPMRDLEEYVKEAEKEHYRQIEYHLLEKAKSSEDLKPKS